MSEINPTMSADEEKMLIQKAQNNDSKAMNKLLFMHRKYIYKVARDKIKKYKNCNIEISDLFTEGSIGLITAIQKFDLSRENKLLTYASWYINQKITSYIVNELSSQNKLSLDAENKNGGILLDTISDTKMQSPEAQAEEQNAKLVLRQSIIEHMNILTEKERRVLTLKYGLDNGRQMTSSEIKDELKCSRAAVRDIELSIRFKLEKAGVDFNLKLTN